ncbi:MAG: hypothetical protein RL557_388 [archaeon]|jgi:hypothetical protein
MRSSLFHSLYFKLFLISIIAFLLIYTLSIFFSIPLKTEVYPVKFIVADKIGVDLNSSEINFGIVMPGGSAVRNLIISNSYDFPIVAEVSTNNNLQPYLFSEEVMLEAHQTKKIPLVLRVPYDMQLGNYSGSVHINFYRR